MPEPALAKDPQRLRVRLTPGQLQALKRRTLPDLGGNAFGDEGGGRLAEVLEECKALVHLNLSWNKISGSGEAGG
eukprot:3736283-Rhodomonas_salina.1